MSAKKRKHELFPKPDIATRLFEGRLTDPHSVLGMHFDQKLDAIIIRVFDAHADKVTIITDGKRKSMSKIDDAGLFATKFADRKEHFAYQLERAYEDEKVVSRDPYSFLPGIGDLDLHLFNEGEHREIYKMMGAHVRKYGDVAGVVFTVWAPNASRVSVVGNFNNWDGRRHPMRLMGSSGIWELFIPDMQPGDIYKFEIRSQEGHIFLKMDPYAYQTELRPRNAAVVSGSEGYQWHDDEWMSSRRNRDWLREPVNVYEVHLASWRGPGLREIDDDDDDDFHNYRDIAHSLADYVCDMGYTHVELLPIAEHPLDQSWGYQVTGFFAPTARYGTPADFAYFIDHLHSRGIGVILDWVPAHFPKDAFSLGRFDGTALYEHADPRQGEHRDWGTYIFNFGRCEVRNFLMGNALFWLDRYHIDGLRVDAVASMLYLDYSREDGEWIPNRYGGNENLEAISFLKRLNELTHELYPGSLMIAEESTAWPAVSRPTYLGGLGFSCKWNMGWMHDTLEYFSVDPVYRSYHQGQLTFSLLYAFSENFILPLSHDEVVHGKRSLLDKMSGTYEQKFANVRALYAYMLTHPGKKLLFMGGEFGQWIEWNSNRGLDWNLLDYPAHQKLQRMLKDLNHLYRESPSLWEQDFEPNGFQWIDCSDYQQSILIYARWDKAGYAPLVIAANLTPVPRDHYTIGVPFGGKWVEAFNTDRAEYGGENILNSEKWAEEGNYHEQSHHVTVSLPGLSVVVLKPEKS